MNELAGRFFVQDMCREDERSSFLIGVGDMAHLNKGHVYEVRKNVLGELTLVDLGKAEAADNNELTNVSMDKFLALSMGSHLKPVAE